MSVLATSQCPYCAAPVYDTKFCEHCGGDVSAWVAPVAAAPPRSVPALVLRIAALVALALAETVPSWAIFVATNSGSSPVGLGAGLFVTFAVLAAILLAIAGLVGIASTTRKVVAAVAAVGYAVISIVLAYAALPVPAPVIFVLVALGYLLLWAAWVVARPVRPRAYLGALVVVYAYGWTLVEQFLPLTRNNWALSILINPLALALAAAVVIVVTIRLARASAVGRFPAVAPDAPIDTLARLSLFLVGGGLVLSFLASLGSLTGFVGFVIIGMLCNLVWWGGIVIAGIGLYRAHRRGARGAAWAGASLALGLGLPAVALLLGAILGVVAPTLSGGY